MNAVTDASMRAALDAMLGADGDEYFTELDTEDGRTFTVTMGTAATQTTWGERRTVAWADLAAMLTKP